MVRDVRGYRADDTLSGGSNHTLSLGVDLYARDREKRTPNAIARSRGCTPPQAECASETDPQDRGAGVDEGSGILRILRASFDPHQRRMGAHHRPPDSKRIVETNGDCVGARPGPFTRAVSVQCP